MKFKNKWTNAQLAAIIKKEGSVSAAARVMGVNRSSFLDYLRNHFPDYPRAEHGVHSMKNITKKALQEVKPLYAGNVDAPTRRVLKGKRFVFTCAQNNTRLNKKFWQSLQMYCQFNDAQLHVSRFTYNKSGFQNAFKDKEGLWYAKEIEPFVLDEAVTVYTGLVFCGELDVLPTAEDPLSGFDSYAGYNSAIVPHAKVAMKSMPRLKGELPRFLYTTGTVTQRNYIQRKAGQKAEFHHVYGALVIEVDKDGYWFVRQLVADSRGEFHDLRYKYTPEGRYVSRPEAVTWGDIHIEKEDKRVSEASWGGSGSILHTLQPRQQFVHDLTDFTARNHHEIGNAFYLAKKHFEKEESVEKDLKKSAAFLAEVSKYAKTIVVESNHHEAFERWLRSADGHRDPANAEFFHTANAQIFRAIRLGDKSFDVYEWALKQYKELDNVIFLKSDESYTICNSGTTQNAIECGIHGHLGINGARGQSRAFRSIGRRSNVGHSHSACILDGVYCAGVSGSMDMGYNRGPSSWSHSHIITYPNGKRAIITIKDGRWKA